MVTLYAEENCDRCRGVAESLEEVAVAREVVTLGGPPHEHEGPEPHTLVDSGEGVRGHKAMLRHIEALRDLAERWRRYQSDVCHDYGDEDGFCEAG